jgi:hypothetical protein
VSRQHRLSKLEAAAPSNIPDAEVGRHCLVCLGERGYRRTVEQIRAGTLMTTPTCTRCGKHTFAGAVVKVRAELGLQ